MIPRAMTHVHIVSALVLGLLLTAGAPPAVAGYGDSYGAAPINNPPASQSVSALPGATRAFWAGACDGAAALAFGADMAAGNGLGARPSSVLVPTRGLPVYPATGGLGFPTAQVLMGASPAADQCLDWGAPTMTVTQTAPDEIWQGIPWGSTTVGQTGQPTPAGDYSPRWRLPAVTQAGAHPDGTTMLAWNRNTEGIGVTPGRVDGSPDNISVDLPPGFMANPQAVPECTAEQFAANPLECPPNSQVGVLKLNMEAPGLAGANLGNFNYDTTYPVFNLVPRQGRVAEIGFSYASSVDAVPVRLTGRARTDDDFGVTAFTGQLPAALLPIAQSITIWGVPWAASHDPWRPLLGHRPGSSPCNRPPGAPPNAKQYIPPGGLPGAACQASYDPSWGAIRPFLSNETDCNPSPTVRLATDAFQHPGPVTREGNPNIPAFPYPSPQQADEASPWKMYTSTSPAVTGCESLAFEPEIDFRPTSSAADDASGLQVDLSIPQNNDPPPAVANDPGEPSNPDGSPGDLTAGAPGHWRSPAGRATAHLKDTVVTLPPGIRVNPSGATGLESCSDAGIGVRGKQGERYLFNNGDPFNKDGGADGAECPEASILGTATVDTPLLAEPLTGRVVLGQPLDTNPQSGNMLRLFIVLRNEERGLTAKIFGSTKANGSVGGGGNGQLTATFLENPEVPFDNLRLEFKGGPRGLIATPQRCGGHQWSASFTPWSAVGAPVGVPPHQDGGGIAVDTRCGFGFGPSLSAGMDNRRARGSGAFAFQFTRNDGEQWVSGLTSKLPRGLLASVRDFPLCTDAQANAGACPGASRLGSVDASAGSGDPFVLEQKGDIYLTEGYKGGEYGLMVKVRAIAGPFRGALELTPIVVRQAIHVDRTTAEVTAISDPFPVVWHGVPLGVRRVTVTVGRPAFMRNPSGCAPRQIRADLASAAGAAASPATLFQATGCRGLRFRPKLSMRLTGRKQVRTGKHPGVRARVTQKGIGEAGIEKAVVRLPKSLALDPENAQALCEFDDGTRDDLENHCPKGSIVGRARAVSPLLNDPLVGNVYFVKNVRRSRSGNLIRTLPMIIVALRGEIAVNLRGESSTTKGGKLVNTFAQVPDAPISRFNLNIKGGKNGILAVTRTRRARLNLCTKPRSHVADADMDGHNGRRFDRNVRMKTPCKKRKQKRKR